MLAAGRAAKGTLHLSLDVASQTTASSASFATPSSAESPALPVFSLSAKQG